MPFRKWLKQYYKKHSDTEKLTDKDAHDDDKEQQQGEDEEKDERITKDIELIYFACNTPNDDLINSLQKLSENIQVFTDEIKCIKYITSITKKVFLIIDHAPSSNLIEEIEKLTQVDSIFIYSPIADDHKIINKNSHHYSMNWCENERILIDEIKKSSDELEKQTIAFQMYDKPEKNRRDLSKETGSFVFFQLFKILIQHMLQTDTSKLTMVMLARSYYRGDSAELANIDDFDQNYKSVDAIPWFMKDCFLHKLVNKALRTEDINLFYHFRFYIMDLSQEIQKKYLQLKEKQQGIVRLYSQELLTDDEITNFQNNPGNFISINGYLSLYSQRSYVYDLARITEKTAGTQRVLFEYHFDLDNNKNSSIADVREYFICSEEADVRDYLECSEQADFLVDIGVLFQIDSCTYNTDEDLWHIQVHASEQDSDLAGKYFEYEKKMISEANTTLLFGDLLIEMGEYDTAEKYFDTILSIEQPSEEEIACIYYYRGRINRLQDNSDRAIENYTRSYNLHMNGPTKRLASAGKTLNGLGTVYIPLDRLADADECFTEAMKLFKKSHPKEHIDFATTLINLGIIDYARGDYDQATVKYIEARNVYDTVLPPGHPKRAFPRINLGNIYLTTGQYELALEEYEDALKLQKLSLPHDHPDIARTLHNITVVHEQQQNMGKEKDPVVTPSGKMKNAFVE